MFEALIATTSSEGLSALGSREQRSFELVTDTVRDHLGDAHAALFAEPVATEHGDRYDWYAPIAGRATRLTDLPEAAADALRATLADLTGDIRTLAGTLRDEGSPDNLRLGEALENALSVPGDAYVYAIGDGETAQPVLVNWAWTSDENRFERGALTGIDTRAAARRAKVAADETTAEAARRRADEQARAAAAKARADRGPLAWLGWLLGAGWVALAVMLGTIVWLMVAPCGLKGPAWLSFCALPAAEANAELAQTATLEDEIDQMQRQIAIADRACQPTPPEPEIIEREVPISAPPAPRSEIEDRLARAGGRTGALTFTLAWESKADLHLEVTCPSGGMVWYGAQTMCGGQLDVGGNHSLASARVDPLESIYFTDPATGRYTVRALLYNTQGQATRQPFRLMMKSGDTRRVLDGTLSGTGDSWTTTFNHTGTP